MKSKIDEMVIEGVTYVPIDSINSKVLAEDLDGMEYVIVRSKESGCHAGYLKKEEGSAITLINARRLWYWSGAASLSQLAMEGVSSPNDCKFPCEVSKITVYGCCEKISVTATAKASINRVPVWKG